MPDTTSGIVKTFIAKFFSCPVEQITDATVADDIEGWDSMANAEIVLALEEQLNVELEIEDLIELDNVGLMVKIFEKRMAQTLSN